jgi:hypothetical protein
LAWQSPAKTTLAIGHDAPASVVTAVEKERCPGDESACPGEADLPLDHREPLIAAGARRPHGEGDEQENQERMAVHHRGLPRSTVGILKRWPICRDQNPTSLLIWDQADDFWARGDRPLEKKGDQPPRRQDRQEDEDGKGRGEKRSERNRLSVVSVNVEVC